MASDANKDNPDDTLATARKRFHLAVEAETEIRREELDDLRFLSGDQWPSDVKQARDLDRRPCLTINRLPQFHRQVTNDQRQNRPSIKVNPVDDKASIETAKVFQGLIRHIEYNSNADIAYDTAFEGSSGKGRGYLRVVTDYCDPYSFDQELIIKAIPNSHAVYFDPNSQEPDGSDSNWAFIFENVPKEDFKAQYKNADLARMSDWESIGDQAPGWIQQSTVRVAEYFYKSFKEITLAQLSTGEIVDKAQIIGEMPEGLSVINERKSILPAIKWCKINGIEILEETDWLGLWIPIIPVYGNIINIDGKRIYEGVIRHAKDPQRMYNYWKSAETETIALAPRAPYIGYAGQFEGFEKQWKTANTRNHTYLEVKPVTVAGSAAPLPQRNVFEPPVQAITQAGMQAAEDIKATTGIYDASLGNRSNEQSGVAIQRRNLQAQTSNFHFVDNMTRSQRHVGRILIDLIPKIYTEPQVIRTINEDGSVDMVAINQVFQKGGQNQAHYLNVGKYDVTVSSGPSYETKRQEASASMLDFTKSLPNVAQFVPDLIARNMDWPGADEFADRLKKTLPPGLADSDKDKQMPIPPQVQAQIGQMNQLIDHLTAELKQTSEIIKTKSIELESRERIEMAKVQAEIEIEMARMGSQEAQTLLKQQVSEIQHRLDLLHEQSQIQATLAAGPDDGAASAQNQVPTDGPQTSGQSMGVQ